MFTDIAAQVLEPMLTYALPAALITMLPGPDTAMVLSTALHAGRRPAARAAWGVGTGLLIWGAAAAFGLAAALRASGVLFTAFQLVCATYLLTMGARTLIAARRGKSAEAHPAGPARRALPLGWGYRRALVTCVFNPKLGVFFVVFLPQFIPAGASVAVTSLALAAVQAVEAVLWYLLLGRLATRARQVLARDRVRAWLDRLSASVFVGFGLRLVTEARV
ncbi:MAG TPA: LysE family translocator [Jatrophihabitans sp.]|jgi:threonine/homoserine/homoserine lactone efflux protein|nr:LysE family translocator [Jatrophihabitans sp.]